MIPLNLGLTASQKVGVRIHSGLTFAKHPGQHPEIERPADAEHFAREYRTLRVPEGAPYSPNCRHTEVVRHEVGDFAVPRSLIRRLTEFLDDRDNPDDC